MNNQPRISDAERIMFLLEKVARKVYGLPEECADDLGIIILNGMNDQKSPDEIHAAMNAFAEEYHLQNARKAVTKTLSDRLIAQLKGVDMGVFTPKADVVILLARRHANSLINGSMDLLRLGFLQGQRAAQAQQRKAARADQRGGNPPDHQELQEMILSIELMRYREYKAGIAEGLRQADEFYSRQTPQPVDAYSYIGETAVAYTVSAYDPGELAQEINTAFLEAIDRYGIFAKSCQLTEHQEVLLENMLTAYDDAYYAQINAALQGFDYDAYISDLAEATYHDAMPLWSPNSPAEPQKEA